MTPQASGQQARHHAPRSARPAAASSGQQLDGVDSSDWDLAVFEADSGRLVAGSAGPDSNELAEGFVDSGKQLVVQACLVDGDATSPSLNVGHMAPVCDAASLEKIQIVARLDAHPRGQDPPQHLGLDVTEHGGSDYVEVVLYGAADEAKLRTAGFTWRCGSPTWSRSSAQPRGRRQLRARHARLHAAERPRGLPPPARLRGGPEAARDATTPASCGCSRCPHQSLEGRDVLGVEIATNVNDLRDGKPVFANMGVHHAREWPSGEHAIEWAFELVNGYNGGNARGRGPRGPHRATIVVPIVNVDGFNLSREAPVDLGPLGDVHPLGYTAAIAGDPGFAFKRRNCRIEDGARAGAGRVRRAHQPRPRRRPQPQLRRALGRPRREHRPGRGHLPRQPARSPSPRRRTSASSCRRDRSPRSSPTTRSPVSCCAPPACGRRARRRTRTRCATSAAAWPPRTATRTRRATSSTTPPGPPRTGATTPRAATATRSRSARTSSIRPSRRRSPSTRAPAASRARATARPTGSRWRTPPTRLSTPCIEGSAPAGSVLRVQKDFMTSTHDPKFLDDDGTETEPGTPFPDHLESTFVVPPSGTFAWHVNPSTRPAVAERTYTDFAAEPSRTEEFESGTPTIPGGGATDEPFYYEEHEFVVTAVGSHGRPHRHRGRRGGDGPRRLPLPRVRRRHAPDGGFLRRRHGRRGGHRREHRARQVRAPSRELAVARLPLHGQLRRVRAGPRDPPRRHQGVVGAHLRAARRHGGRHAEGDRGPRPAARRRRPVRQRRRDDDRNRNGHDRGGRQHGG